MSSEAFSETLQFITDVKLAELSKRYQLFRDHHQKVQEQDEQSSDASRRLNVLVQGMRDWSGAWSPDARPADLSQFADYARAAPNFPQSIVDTWSSAARAQLAHEGMRFEFATLFGRLLTEWLESNEQSGARAGEDFEQVSRKETLEQKAKLESLIFEAKDVDVAALNEYLQQLFSEKAAAEALDTLRLRIKRFSGSLERRTIGTGELQSVIRSVLRTDLLSEKKQATLKEFLRNAAVLEELASVLNMQISSLQTWSWPETGVPVEPRRHLNGKTRFFLDSEILTCLLLYYLDLLWASEFRAALSDLRFSRAWKAEPHILNKDEKARRDAFMGREYESASLYAQIKEVQSDHYFLCQLPKSLEDCTDHYAEETDAQPKRRTRPQSPGGKPRFETPVGLKQSLLHMLAAEVAINKFKHRKYCVVRTDLEWFGPSLPFDTLATVLRFFGVPERDVRFVLAFLACPIKFKDDPSGAVRVRRRGVPLSHPLSTLCGELTLFVMDFAVNQRADGLFLYRIHDDFWLWDSDASRCAKAWAEMRLYCRLAGMSFNAEKTGSVVVGADGADVDLPPGDVRWGFLRLEDDGRFSIDQAMIDKHITEMRRQLAAAKSVFGWVQAYNKYMDFVVRNCGAPAMVFGVEHVDAIVSTVTRVQRALSEDGVVAAVGKMLEQRFAVDVGGLPHGWFYWPCAAGGLELKEHIIDLFLLKEAYIWPGSVDAILRSAERSEERKYEEASLRWSEGAHVRAKSRWDITVVTRDEPFFCRDEYARGWKEQSSDWGRAYSDLLTRPTSSSVPSTPALEAALQVLGREGRAAFGIADSCRWSSLRPYWQWIAGIYHDEMVEKFGSLAIVEPSSVPVGMVSVFKSSKMRWEQ